MENNYEIRNNVAEFLKVLAGNQEDAFGRRMLFGDNGMEALRAAAEIVRKVDRGELVEVVRCADCTEFEEKEGYFPICRLRSKADYRPHKDGYCDMGERKEEKHATD